MSVVVVQNTLKLVFALCIFAIFHTISQFFSWWNMASPSRSTLIRHGTSSLSVEDSPVMGLTHRAVPMGSLFVRRSETETHKLITPRRRLSLPVQASPNEGDGSKSVEIVEPKNEIAHTPNRPITRSITILSDSNDRDTQADKEEVKWKSHTNISGKRLIDTLGGDSSSKKKKLLLHNVPQAKISANQTPNAHQKAYDFIIHPKDRFGGTINVFFKNDVIANLRAKLTETQKVLFQSTCFGHFLQLSDIRLQNQVIHKLLLLEVRQPAIDEMWFEFDGNLLKFSIHEFCLASGLKCDGDDNTNMFKMGGECRIREKYFKELKSVFRKDVKHTFKKLPLDTPDEDVVKIGMLYLISTFLFTSTQRKVVTDALMRLVDSPCMNSFPWGKELFQTTFKYLKNALSKAQLSGGDAKGILTYRLHGFPLAFQTWVYESIPSLSKKFCRRVRYGSPRIINWANDDKRVSAASIEKLLFELVEVEVVQMKPTEQEKSAPYYIGLCAKGTAFPPLCNSPLKHHFNSNGNKTTPQKDTTPSNCGSIPSSSKQSSDAKDMNAHIIGMIEELKAEMAQIRDNQVQILHSQTDIKLNITRIELEFKSKFQSFMEGMSKENNLSMENEITGKSPVISNAPVSLNNKFLASLEKSSSKKGGASGSNTKSNTEAAQNLSSLKEDNVTIEHPGKKLHAHNYQVASLDEIQFTDEDLMQVDQIVKSARSMKGKCMAQGDGPMLHSPEIQKKVSFSDHIVVEAPFAKVTAEKISGHAKIDHSSPYSRDVVSFQQTNIHFAQRQSPLEDIFGSTTKVLEMDSPGQEIYAMYELFPFNIDMSEPNEEDVTAFHSWFSDGYKPGLIKYKFPPMKDAIKPPFQFGPYVIASKTWWHELRECNVYLRDSHLNVCFYYFRKMLRFSSMKSFNCTTTDSFFGSMVRGAYSSCRQDIHSISNFKSLVEIACGNHLHCNSKWTEVDHVLIPIMMEKKAHWMLAHFSINERTLYVYNPSRLTVRDRVVTADMEAFAYVIPCLMVKLGAWERNSVDRVEPLDPLDVKIVSDIPQDEYGHDCGLFVIKYAEFIMRKESIMVMPKFNPNTSRLHLAVQLYKYGCEKIIEGYETDYDQVTRSVRMQRKPSSSKNV